MLDGSGLMLCPWRATESARTARTVPGWWSIGIGQSWRYSTAASLLTSPGSSGRRGSRSTRGRPGISRAGLRAWRIARRGRGTRPAVCRWRWRPRSVRCAGSIRGGVRSGSRSSWPSVVSGRRRAGRPRIGCWCVTGWSTSSSNSIGVSTDVGSAMRRCSCGSSTSWAGCSWPTAENASWSPELTITPGSW